MYYEEGSRTANFVAGLLIGAVLGAGVALLVAPQSGRRTRRRLMQTVAGARELAGERFGELSDDVRTAVSTGRRRLRL